VREGGRKAERKEGKKEGRKVRRKAARKEGRQQGRKQARKEGNAADSLIGVKTAASTSYSATMQLSHSRRLDFTFPQPNLCKTAYCRFYICCLQWKINWQQMD
jgi:hypothetical protein